MASGSVSTMESFRAETEPEMKTYRPLSGTFILSFLGGALLTLLPAAPARAQAISTFTVQVSGVVSGAGTAAGPEAVSFSGPVQITSTVVTDPTGGPPSTVVFVDAQGVTGKGLLTGAAYVNSGQANLTRMFGAADVIKTTFAFFPNTASGFMKARTALLTLVLTYDLTSQALTSAAGVVGNQ
jgi:hypothetical protein